MARTELKTGGIGISLHLEPPQQAGKRLWFARAVIRYHARGKLIQDVRLGATGPTDAAASRRLRECLCGLSWDFAALVGRTP